MTSQVGEELSRVDVAEEGCMTVKEYIKKHYGFEHDFLGAVAAAHVGFVLLFFFVFAYGIKFLNFQRR